MSGVAHWEVGAGWSKSKHLWTVLWRRLLLGAVHISDIKPSAIHTLHVAGRYHTAFILLFCLNTHSVPVTTQRTGSLYWQDLMSYNRVVMPLKMRSQLVPTRLSILITNTMEPRCRSGWSWERSHATSWQFLKANSSSLRYSMTFHRNYFLVCYMLKRKKKDQNLGCVGNYSRRLEELLLQCKNKMLTLFPEKTTERYNCYKIRIMHKYFDYIKFLVVCIFAHM